MPDYTPDNIEPEDVLAFLETADRFVDRANEELRDVPSPEYQRALEAVCKRADIIARHFADPEPQEPGLDPAGEDKERRHGG